MEKLSPCPFCCDPMEDRGYGAIHIDGKGCPIGDLAIDMGKWNSRALDAGSSARTDTLERRLADCLSTCIDTPLLTGALGGDARISTGLRLGFFNPELADRAAALIEEAGI